MKKLLGLIFAMFMLVACSSENADEKYVGKWISVAGEAYGVTLTGEEISGFGLNLQNGGNAVLTVDGDSANVKWKNEGDVITVTANGTDMTATVKNDTMVFDNMLDMGLKLTFAKEGTDAANPENYLSEAEKNMIGTWQSDSVSDILGDPIDTYSPDALKLEFYGDHKMNITLDGETVSDKKWSLLGDDWGSADDESVNINWEIEDDGISVNYIVDNEYYVFHCVKK